MHKIYWKDSSFDLKVNLFYFWLYFAKNVHPIKNFSSIEEALVLISVGDPWLMDPDPWLMDPYPDPTSYPTPFFSDFMDAKIFFVFFHIFSFILPTGTLSSV